jgi:hypothetical protein
VQKLGETHALERLDNLLLAHAVNMRVVAVLGVPAQRLGIPAMNSASSSYWI